MFRLLQNHNFTKTYRNIDAFFNLPLQSHHGSNMQTLVQVNDEQTHIHGKTNFFFHTLSINQLKHLTLEVAMVAGKV